MIKSGWTSGIIRWHNKQIQKFCKRSKANNRTRCQLLKNQTKNLFLSNGSRSKSSFWHDFECTNFANKFFFVSLIFGRNTQFCHFFLVFFAVLLLTVVLFRYQKRTIWETNNTWSERYQSTPLPLYFVKIERNVFYKKRVLCVCLLTCCNYNLYNYNYN